MRKTGVEITETIKIPVIVYLCDTTIQCFEDYPELVFYNNVMCECTFFRDGEEELAKQSKHIHWSELKPIVLANPRTKFILIHFSMRYSNNDIKEFFDGENLSNIEPWLN